MPEHGISLNHIFSDKDRIEGSVLVLENMGQRKFVFWHNFRSVWDNSTDAGCILNYKQVKLIFKYHEICSKITEPDKKLRKKIQFSSKFAKRKVAKITITGD